jgi:hypothetical protein
LIGGGKDLGWNALDLVILAPGDHGEDHYREEPGAQHPRQPKQNHGEQQGGIAEIGECHVCCHYAQP